MAAIANFGMETWKPILPSLPVKTPPFNPDAPWHKHIYATKGSGQHLLKRAIARRQFALPTSATAAVSATRARGIGASASGNNLVGAYAQLSQLFCSKSGRKKSEACGRSVQVLSPRFCPSFSRSTELRVGCIKPSPSTKKQLAAC